MNSLHALAFAFTSLGGGVRTNIARGEFARRWLAENHERYCDARRFRSGGRSLR